MVRGRERVAQFLGILGLVLTVFGLLTQLLVSEDEYHLVHGHLIIGALCLIVFLAGGGQRALSCYGQKSCWFWSWRISLFSTLCRAFGLFKLHRSSPRIHSLSIPPQTSFTLLLHRQRVYSLDLRDRLLREPFTSERLMPKPRLCSIATQSHQTFAGSLSILSRNQS